MYCDSRNRLLFFCVNTSILFTLIYTIIFNTYTICLSSIIQVISYLCFPLNKPYMA